MPPRRRRRAQQPGGQFSAIASVLGPIVAKEVAKVIIPKIRKQLGFGLNVAGGRRGRGLKLAGQGKHRMRRKPVKRRKVKRKRKPAIRRPRGRRPPQFILL